LQTAKHFDSGWSTAKPLTLLAGFIAQLSVRSADLDQAGAVGELLGECGEGGGDEREEG